MNSEGEPVFRIAVLGDFSGRANRGVRTPLRAVPIDPGNFEEVMEELGVALDLPAGPLQFRELDDFHPDHLYQTFPPFQAIREAKKQLANPQTFRAVAEKPAAAPPRGGLLDMIAAQSAAPAPVSARDEASWDQAIRNIAAKHATPGRDARQEEALALVDQAAAVQLRALLADTDFQALEAVWRSIFFLFRYVETGVELQVELVDVSKTELPQKIEEFHKLFAEPALGDAPWSLLVGLFTFLPDAADCDLLAKLSAIARQAGAPFLAAIDPVLFGCQSMSGTPDPDDWKTPSQPESWRWLRRSPDAMWLGLAFPRFLLRLPYGKKTSSVDSFDFEEMPGDPQHGAYLWGNPAVACAAMIGESFNRQAEDLRLGSVNRLDGLPVHSFPTRESTPTAEVWMTDRLATEILDAGIMPLASIKHRDAVQLVRFQSIADPPQPLAGPW